MHSKLFSLPAKTLNILIGGALTLSLAFVFLFASDTWMGLYASISPINDLNWLLFEVTGKAFLANEIVLWAPLGLSLALLCLCIYFGFVARTRTKKNA